MPRKKPWGKPFAGAVWVRLIFLEKLRPHMTTEPSSTRPWFWTQSTLNISLLVCPSLEILLYQQLNLYQRLLEAAYSTFLSRCLEEQLHRMAPPKKDLSCLSRTKVGYSATSANKRLTSRTGQEKQKMLLSSNTGHFSMVKLVYRRRWGWIWITLRQGFTSRRSGHRTQWLLWW